MRVIAEVVYGPHQQRKAVLAPGETKVIGADLPSHFIVSKDRALSKTHFELSWDGAQCQLRTLSSAGVTELDGQPVKQAVVPHASWIRAGRTDFMIYHEHATPPVSDDGQPPAPDTPEEAAQKRAALSQLRGLDQPLYVVLDAARARYILILLRESIDRYQSLYEGMPGEDLAEVAPYLVQLAPDSPLLDRLIEHGWGRRWGFYLTSAKRFIDVRRHLRRFLMVIDGNTNERMYFRFYDPHALNVFMQVATPKQRQAFEEAVTIVPVGEPRTPLQWGSATPVEGSA